MSNDKAKGKKGGKLLQPGMLMLAAMFLWAADHEPARFTAGSLTGWVLGAVSVALLVRAGLALLAPALRILGIVFGHAFKALQSGAES
jgi:hypothetical protein